MAKTSIRENAVTLLTEIQAALKAGTRHYARDGRPLNTAREIVEALLADGEITFEPERQRSDDEASGRRMTFVLYDQREEKT